MTVVSGLLAWPLSPVCGPAKEMSVRHKCSPETRTARCGGKEIPGQLTAVGRDVELVLSTSHEWEGDAKRRQIHVEVAVIRAVALKVTHGALRPARFGSCPLPNVVSVETTHRRKVALAVLAADLAEALGPGIGRRVAPAVALRVERAGVRGGAQHRQLLVVVCGQQRSRIRAERTLSSPCCCAHKCTESPRQTLRP